MLERFDATASRAVAAAADEARGLGHHYVGTEHLLLGLLALREERAARALALLGTDRDAVHGLVVDILGMGETPVSDEGHLSFTPRARTVLEMAEAERIRLGVTRIDGTHLLLALVRERDGVAAQLLAHLDVGIKQVERALSEIP
jgi:ATP-dependent Clp protease ATP-binding subunit ClpC